MSQSSLWFLFNEKTKAGETKPTFNVLEVNYYWTEMINTFEGNCIPEVPHACTAQYWDCSSSENQILFIPETTIMFSLVLVFFQLVLFFILWLIQIIPAVRKESASYLYSKVCQDLYAEFHLCLHNSLRRQKNMESWECLNPTCTFFPSLYNYYKFYVKKHKK